MHITLYSQTSAHRNKNTTNSNINMVRAKSSRVESSRQSQIFFLKQKRQTKTDEVKTVTA